MKKNIITLTLLASFVFSPLSFAGGIPTIDVAAIAEAEKMLLEARNQLKELQTQVATAKSQLDDFRKEAEETKKRLEGYTDFSNIFDSSTEYLKDTLNDFKSDIKQVEIDDYLKSKGVDVQDNTELKADYERKVEQIKRYEKIQTNLESQSTKLDKLQREFRDATTPQKREEILNTIQLENLKMQNTMKTVELEMKKQEQEQEIEKKEAVVKYLNSEMETFKPKGFIDLTK
ncbi:type IV secretion system protein [Providencia sp. 2024EL-00732]|uniref:type IV secretion system protein n=1 Tax=Providencia sp. 2024EL-00732 TaxID=3374242 RepID=UPI0024AA078E